MHDHNNIMQKYIFFIELWLVQIDELFSTAVHFNRDSNTTYTSTS